MRRKTLFNSDWKFVKENVGAEKAAEAPGEQITLPHTWNAKDGQDGGNDYYRGTCWYVKKFQMPEHVEDEEVWIEFFGVAMTAEVYLNGKKLMEHAGGYSTFRADMTPYLMADGVNVLAVSADNSDNDTVYPQKADFTFYGGIYRDVNVLVVPKTHFALGYCGAPGIRVTPQINGADAEVKVETWLEGLEETAGDAAVKVTVTDMQGENVAAMSLNDICCGDGGTSLLHIPQVHLWNGVKDPYLYHVKAELVVNGNVMDEVEADFGCRTFEFDAEKGFILNGESYPLRGVSRHQDWKGVGNALTKELHEKDMEIIREIGANTIRLAHYQHDQYFYDLCDKYGMVVWAEIPYITKHMENGRENTLSQMRELVTQCYNHPSIVCWGLSNEITASGSVSEDMLENHRLLNDMCHELDATRPTTMASVFMLETDSPINDIPDIRSYNLYFGWYIGELEQNDSFFDEFHKKYPEKIIGFSEYGADANLQFQTATPDKGDYTEQYQAFYHEHVLQMIEERPYIWASHLWNMFDFAADGRVEGGAHGVNQKGIVSFDRKEKKDTFYLYKAHWSGEPFVHVCGRRYIDRTEAVTTIKVYSNQEHVALYVDGKLLEEKAGKNIFEFEVPLGEPEESLKEIKAVSDKCEDIIHIHRVTEPNPAYAFAKETIVNWFDKEDINPEFYSIKDKLGDIKQNLAGAAMINRMMAQAAASRGDVAASTAGNANLEKMLNQMSVESLLKQAGDAIPPEQVKALNAALQKIKK